MTCAQRAPLGISISASFSCAESRSRLRRRLLGAVAGRKANTTTPFLLRDCRSAALKGNQRSLAAASPCNALLLGGLLRIARLVARKECSTTRQA